MIEEIEGGSAATTEILDVPTPVPADAVIETLPTLRAVTSPAVLTVAMVVSLLAHVGVTPVTMMPDVSDAEAAIVTVSPTSSDKVVGLTETLATLAEGPRS